MMPRLVVETALSFRGSRDDLIFAYYEAREKRSRDLIYLLYFRELTRNTIRWLAII